MPSTYTTNNGIELIGTGEQSGTWGDTTNTNLTLVDASLDGHTSITLASAGTSGSPNDVPITNGSTSNGRNRALIFTDGGDLGADVYVRLTPNDAKKIMFVRNSLSGSRNLILFQGTYNASNDFVLAAGKDAIVKFDGGGSGAVASAVLADFALDAATITTISNTTLNTATVNATTVDTTNIEVTNLKAKDGVSAGSIANSTGVVTLASSVLTTTDINGGTVDGVTIGGSSAGVGTFTTVNATTVDTTNIEVTNLKAKDGTSAGSIADSTGVVTLASSVLTTTEINGGTIDGTTIGGSTPAAVTGTTGVFSNDLTVDTDTLYVDSANDRVGINNASPSVALDVTGIVASDTRFKVSTGVDAVTNADDIVVSRSGGANVGISLLSSDTGVSRLYFGGQTDTTSAKLQHSENSQQMTLQAEGELRLQTGGTVDRVTIDSSGNVGIGNNSPSVPLDVTGNAAFSDKVKIGTGADANGNADELVMSKDQNNVGMSLLAADATGIVRIYLGSQTDTTAASIRHSESSDRLVLQAKGDLYFQTGGSGTTMTLNGSGDLDVTGALSKGSGSFKISHPLKPDTHHLVHSFIEGPQADNIYRGRVALVGGTATVNLDTAGRMSEGTFVALNGNVQCFTSNEQGWTAVRGSISGNVLTIEAQDAACTDTVSWMVIGERHDQHMIDTLWTDADGRVITEPEKPPVEEDETV